MTGKVDGVGLVRIRNSVCQREHMLHLASPAVQQKNGRRSRRAANVDGKVRVRHVQKSVAGSWKTQETGKMARRVRPAGNH
jgi:hypothetical protein